MVNLLKQRCCTHHWFEIEVPLFVIDPNTKTYLCCSKCDKHMEVTAQMWADMKKEET